MRKGIFLSVICSLLVLAGCGGGGSGGGGSTAVISGVASKGPFVSGTVNVYDVSGGIASKVKLQTGSINSDGTYSITIAPSSTPVMVEIAAGSKYKDETNPGGPSVTLNTPLRALLPSVAVNTPVAVTPFTELAVTKALAAASLSKAVIDDANTSVSQLFQVPDIISTMPVDASSGMPSGATSDRINYGIALAGVSQLIASSPGKTLADILADLAVTSGSVDNTAAGNFRTAVNTFLGSANNKTDASSINNTPFVNVGTKVTTSLAADKSTALANNSNDTITLTASFSTALPDNTEITFTVASGSAKFADGSTTFKAKTSGGTASAAVKSATAGDAKITATYVPGSSADSTVTFVAAPTVSLTASKSFAQPGGTIRFTATLPSVAAGYSDITFTVTSGAGTFGGQSSKIVSLTDKTASADLVSASAGNVVVTATYAVSSTALATVTFAPAATAVVDVGLNKSFSNVYYLDFDMSFTPTGGITASPVVTAINEASGKAKDPVLIGVVNNVAKIGLIKIDTSTPGYSIVANSPVVRMTYTIVSGSPEFALDISGYPAPLGITDPNDYSQSRDHPALTKNDYVVTVTYKDASGNTL